MIRNVPFPAVAPQAVRSFSTSIRKLQLSSLSSQQTRAKPSFKIEEPYVLRFQSFRGKQIKSFEFKFSKVHAFSITALGGKEVETPYGDTIFSRRWKDRKDTLWWTVTAYKSFSAKSVVRTHGSRKLRTAFVESLRKKGIAPDGSWLDPSDQTKEAIKGTVFMTPVIPILATRMKDLVFETDAAVERIISLQHNGDFTPRMFKPYSKGGSFTRNARGNVGVKKDLSMNSGTGTGLKISRG